MRIVVVLVSLFLLQGCYYAQAVHGQLSLLSKREPVAGLIADPATPAELRAKLELAVELRAYASDHLGLPDNDSYTSYVDLGRPYVVWSVTATPEFSVQPVTWCFPFAGCVAYRGYFEREAAERFATRMRTRGHDVRVGGVGAYSTLGWFSDPLLSSMVAQDEIELAALIFHELAHQQLYVRDDTAFNEAFATVVEEEGVRRWLEARGRPEAIDGYRERRERRTRFAELLGTTRAELAQLYAAGGDPETLRAAKASAFDELRVRYRESGLAGYDGWFERELNNADLAAVATYNARAPELRTLLAELEHDLPAFYSAAAALGQRNAAKRPR